MKKKKAVAIVAFCALSVAAVLSVSYMQGVMREYERKGATLPEGFTITAHTGSSHTKDNSLESIRYGGNNADVIEFDLNFTEDGTAVLSHDKPIGDEVTLDEAFTVVSKYENLKVNVDLKSDTNLPAIQTLAEKHGILDRIFFTGVDSSERVAKIKRHCPRVSYYLNVDVDCAKNTDKDYLMSLVSLVKERGAVGINFDKGSASKELCDIFREEGLLVSIWTVNSELDMHKILSFGPDNITTRKPVRLSEIILGIKNS